MSGKRYYRPGNVEQCLEFLHNEGRDAVLLAGGTDVMVDLRAGEIDRTWIVDVSRLPELRGVRLQKHTLWIGAGVTLTELLGSSLVQMHTRALHRAALHFAARQIRNVATIGGNVAHCSPSADTLPPLLVHEAEAVVAGSYGRRRIPVGEVAAGTYRSSLEPTELIIGFELQPRAPFLSDFQKIGRRRELVIARVNMAALADLDAEQRMNGVRFALGSCTPVPLRFPEVETLLEGSRPSRELFWEAGRLAAESMIALSGRRPSFIYKEKAVQGLVYRLFSQVLDTDKDKRL